MGHNGVALLMAQWSDLGASMGSWVMGDSGGSMWLVVFVVCGCGWRFLFLFMFSFFSYCGLWWWVDVASGSDGEFLLVVA